MRRMVRGCSPAWHWRDHPARPSCGGVGWGGPVSCPVVVWLRGWGWCLLGCSWDDGVAAKLCWVRVPAASLARRKMGSAVVQPAAWVWLPVPRLLGWRVWGELERGTDGGKTQERGRN